MYVTHEVRYHIAVCLAFSHFPHIGCKALSAHIGSSRIIMTWYLMNVTP